MGAPAASGPWWREPDRQQWTTFGAAWLGWCLDAFDFTLFVLVMPLIAQEFGVTFVSTTLSLTLTLVVRLLGGWTAGWAADRWGRKGPLMASIAWFAVCDGLVAVAPSFTVVLVLRTLFGFGMGAEWTAGSALVMETWPPRSRGIASGLLQGSWAVGYLLAAVVTGALLPVIGWRGLFLVAAAPALLVIPIRFLVQEPPRAAPVPGRGSPVAPLERRFFGRLAWACGYLALAFGGYYALVGLYPTLLQRELGFTAVTQAPLITLFNVGMLVGAAACGYAVTRLPVRWVLAVPSALVVLVAPLYVGWGGRAWLELAAFLAGALGAGTSGVTPLLLATLFPEAVRGRLMGLAYHAGAFAAAFVPLGIATLAQGWPTSLSTAVAAAAIACEVGLVAFVLGSRAVLDDAG